MASALRSARAIVTIALGALLSVGVLASPAYAGQSVSVAKLETELPKGTAEVWIAAEHGGIQAQRTTLAVAAGTGKAALVSLSRTTFGAGAVVPAAGSRITAYLASGVDATPDISLTAVDSGGRILSVASSRVSLTAHAGTDLESLTGESTPVDLVPTDPQSPITSKTPSSAGALGVTGGAVAWTAALVAAALIALGALLLIRRKQNHAVIEEDLR